MSQAVGSRVRERTKSGVFDRPRKARDLWVDARTTVRASPILGTSVKLLFLLFLATFFLLFALVLLFLFFFRHLYDSFHVLDERSTACLVYGRIATPNFTRFAPVAPSRLLVPRLLLSRCG
jgi:hypothetical protein